MVGEIYLNAFTDEQLYKIRDVGRNRLSPDGQRAFLIIVFYGSSFLNLIPFFADRSHEVQILWITVVVNIFLGLWVIHGLFVLFFLSLERSIRYQRLLAVVVNVVFVKFTLDAYLLYLVDIKEKRIELMLLGLVSLAFGVAYLLWSVRRAFVNIVKGEAREEGRGLLYPGHCVAWVMTPFVSIAVLLMIVILMTLTGMGNAWLLPLAAPLQWILSYAYPEYYFIAYYRWTNPAFIYERPNRKKKG